MMQHNAAVKTQILEGLERSGGRKLVLGQTLDPEDVKELLVSASVSPSCQFRTTDVRFHKVYNKNTYL